MYKGIFSERTVICYERYTYRIYCWSWSHRVLFCEKIQPVLKDNLRIIAGSRRKEQLEKEGRIINGHQRFFHVVSPEENTGYSDLVLVCSKMTGLEQALKDARNQVGP